MQSFTYKTAGQYLRVSILKNTSKNLICFRGTNPVFLNKACFYHRQRSCWNDDQGVLSANNINIGNEATMKKSEHSSMSVRTKLRVADVLKGIESQKNFIVSQDSTVGDAMAHLVEQKISSSLVINKQDGSIAGIFTARDLLKNICKHGSPIQAPTTTITGIPTNNTQVVE